MDAQPAAVRCKPYHQPQGPSDPGVTRDRTGHTKKSRCPSWAVDAKLQSVLMREALRDPEAGTDSFGRPKRLWNAVAQCYFVAVSTNETQPAYNCYPDVPATSLFPELTLRAERTLEELMSGPHESV